MSFAGSSDGLCIPLPSEDEVTNCFIIDDLLANRAHHPQLNIAYKVRTSIITSTTYILRYQLTQHIQPPGTPAESNKRANQFNILQTSAHHSPQTTNHKPTKICTYIMAIPPTFPAATLADKTSREHDITTRSLPPLGADEVGIRITATAINPVDWKIRDYGVFLDSYPAVLGSDAAGTIAAVGSNVSNFAIGDRVFFQGIVRNYDSSTFQTYCKMPAALVAKTPSLVSDEQAAGISLATVAALTGIYDRSGRGVAPPPWEAGGAQAGKGKAMVVLGGSSSVGQYAIQLARLSGYDQIVTSASQSHHEYLKGLGATVVLDRMQATVSQYVAGLGSLPIDFVFDSISLKDTQVLGIEILQAAKVQAGSPLVTVMQPEADAQALGASKEPKVEVHAVMGLGSAPNLRYLSEPLFAHLGGEDGWVATGEYVPNRVVVVEGGLEKIDEALNKNRAGASGEKVVLRL